MSVICWSSHPVWGILETFNLPPEIILKIFSFKTVLMSPTRLPMDEFSEIENKTNDCCINCNYLRHNNLLETFITQLFNMNNIPYERYFTLVDSFLIKNQRFKPKNKEKLYKNFLEYIEIYKLNSEDPLDAYFHCTYKYIDVYKKNLIETILFTLCNNEYCFNIMKIFNTQNIDNKVESYILDSMRYDVGWGEIYFWKYMIYAFINKKKVTKNKLSIVNLKTTITNSTLIKWCNILGIKHYKSWKKAQLIGSIFKNEASDFDNSYF